ncbi:MAG: LysE family translocator [Desulfobacterales bacterium]|nr:LysE family translocator [Desulfobacterales bacterium]
MTLEFWMIYAATVFIASIVPGPSMLLALTHGMKYGAGRTAASAAGNVTASLIQAGISMAGLGAILTASENLFLAVKWAGAAYLIFLGLSLFRSPRMAVSVDTDSNGDARSESAYRMFAQAFLVAAGNPKAIVFFTALFPQFIIPGGGTWQQAFLLIATLAIIAFGCFMIYAVGGEKMIALFSRGWLGRHLNRIVGTAFIGAGLGLFYSRR